MRRSGFTACLLSVAFMIVTAQSAGLAQNLEPFRDWFGSYGFTDSDGNIVIECRFDDVRGFTEGLAPVLSRSGNVNGEGGVFGSLALTLKWGYIDTVGNVVVPLKYAEVYPFAEGMAAVKAEGKWGFVDRTTGKEVVSVKYDNVKSFKGGLASVGLNGKMGFINKTGEETVPLIYNGSRCRFSDGLAAMSMNGKWGFVDTVGRVVIPFKYDFVYDFSDGMAHVSMRGKHGYIGKDNKAIVSVIYDDISQFYGNIAQAKSNNGKWGLVDRSGNVVMPFKCDYIGPFVRGIAAALQGRHWGCIDNKGKEVVPFIYDRVEGFQEDGRYLVYLKGECVFLDVAAAE